jgi:hypothetical protein
MNITLTQHSLIAVGLFLSVLSLPLSLFFFFGGGRCSVESACFVALGPGCMVLSLYHRLSVGIHSFKFVIVKLNYLAAKSLGVWTMCLALNSYKKTSESFITQV